MIKEKPCCGSGKAKGFEGCGKLIKVEYREYGLGKTCCLYDWYTTTEAGKIEFAKRKIKVEKKNWQEKKKVLRNNTKTLSQYEAEAKTSFQKWIRLRDKDLPCISCGTSKDVEYAGGHYFKAELYSGLIFDERNVHKQCNAYCNKFRDGAQAEYRMGLVARYGKEYVEALEIDSIEKRNYKYTKDELIGIKKDYDNRIKLLKQA